MLPTAHTTPAASEPHTAQIELQEALAALVERWESFEIAGEVVPQASNQTNGVLELPLRFRPA
ncbi:hypothetical protein [Sorangium cellulosum]|nr:hypothetical protein [Sorangium cellulosum]